MWDIVGISPIFERSVGSFLLYFQPCTCLIAKFCNEKDEEKCCYANDIFMDQSEWANNCQILDAIKPSDLLIPYTRLVVQEFHQAFLSCLRSKKEQYFCRSLIYCRRYTIWRRQSTRTLTYTWLIDNSTVTHIHVFFR